MMTMIYLFKNGKKKIKNQEYIFSNRKEIPFIRFKPERL